MTISKLKKPLSILLCVSMAAILFSSCNKEEEPAAKSVETTKASTVASTNVNPFTGVAGLSEASIGKRPVAIMVENSPDARPQWGLCTPDIVVEGLVEGGITRMMWVYADVSAVKKIGPTRSARHDYVELAEGLDAIYVHFGGSNYAYDTLKTDKVNDIDGMYDSSAFARDKSRNVSSEHTAYTTGSNIITMIGKKGYRTDINDSAKSPFSFSTDKRALTGGTCNSVAVAFSNSYKHTFKYNSSDGLYYNYMNSSEMKDADGKTMSVSNVVILYTNVSPVPSSTKGHVDWDLSSGKGVYVSNGTYENITWSKGSSSNATSALKLKDASGNELKLNTGNMWLGFVPASNSGSTAIS